jgi:hypothetical protein
VQSLISACHLLDLALPYETPLTLCLSDGLPAGCVRTVCSCAYKLLRREAHAFVAAAPSLAAPSGALNAVHLGPRGRPSRGARRQRPALRAARQPPPQPPQPPLRPRNRQRRPQQAREAGGQETGSARVSAPLTAVACALSLCSGIVEPRLSYSLILCRRPWRPCWRSRLQCVILYRLFDT